MHHCWYLHSQLEQPRDILTFFQITSRLQVAHSARRKCPAGAGLCGPKKEQTFLEGWSSASNLQNAIAPPTGLNYHEYTPYVSMDGQFWCQNSSKSTDSTSSKYPHFRKCNFANIQLLI